MPRPGITTAELDSEHTIRLACQASTQSTVATVQELVRRLNACASGLRACVERHLTRHGLTVAQSQVLWRCRQSESSQSQLAQQLAISPAQVCGLVEQLRQGGLLAGKRSDTDRRCQLWQLTAAGHGLLEILSEQLEHDFAVELRQSYETNLAPLSELLNEVRQQIATSTSTVDILPAHRMDPSSDRMPPSAEAA